MRWIEKEPLLVPVSVLVAFLFGTLGCGLVSALLAGRIPPEYILRCWLWAVSMFMLALYLIVHLFIDDHGWWGGNQ